MKKTACFLFLVAAAVLVASPATWAQSPNEQLIQLVEKLQASPDDDALREQIIKLARKIKPRPVIPEEARQHFVEGIAIAQSAKDAESQKLAVSSFKAALNIAPWWSDAYYNLAVAQELAGELDDAQSSLKFYILTNPGESEARDAQDRIYALNGKKKIAEAEAAAQAERVVRENAEKEKNDKEALIQSLDGAVFVWEVILPPDDTLVARETIEIHGKQVTQSSWALEQPTETMTGTLEGLTADLCCGKPGTLGGEPGARMVLEVSPDGSRATRTFINAGGTVLEVKDFNRR